MRLAHVKDDIAPRRGWSQPDEDYLSLSVDISHTLNLGISLEDISLVDAYGIYKQPIIFISRLG
jgi:hypothetical protein